MKRVGVVVPTLFSRDDYLRQSLEAIQRAGESHVILMGPNVETNARGYAGLFHELLEEPMAGTLPEKLNKALSLFPEEIDLITWIGDDDLLSPSSLESLVEQFDNDPDLSLIYGACDYIDSSGAKIGHNKSGPWALRVAKIGPFLAPQPGSLFRRSVFEKVGRLDPRFTLAFDFDLFLSISRKGKTKYVADTLASFRWHRESLSVGQRKSSVKQASLVRKKHASFCLRVILFITNPVVEAASYAAGFLINLMLSKRARG